MADYDFVKCDNCGQRYLKPKYYGSKLIPTNEKKPWYKLWWGILASCEVCEDALETARQEMLDKARDEFSDIIAERKRKRLRGLL